MKYLIIRAQCKFSDGTTKVFHYKNNACTDIELFRTNLRKAIKAQSIRLVYEERDNRK